MESKTGNPNSKMGMVTPEEQRRIEYEEAAPQAPPSSIPYGGFDLGNPQLAESLWDAVRIEEPQNDNRGDTSWFGKIGNKPKGVTPEEQWFIDNPPADMPPVDFSSAPAWWDTGGGEPVSVPTAPTPAPSPAPMESSPIMLDVIGNLGGTSGFTGQTPMNKNAALAAALRSGGE